MKKQRRRRSCVVWVRCNFFFFKELGLSRKTRSLFYFSLSQFIFVFFIFKFFMDWDQFSDQIYCMTAWIASVSYTPKENRIILIFIITNWYLNSRFYSQNKLICFPFLYLVQAPKKIVHERYTTIQIILKEYHKILICKYLSNCTENHCFIREVRILGSYAKYITVVSLSVTIKYPL